MNQRGMIRILSIIFISLVLLFGVVVFWYRTNIIFFLEGLITEETIPNTFGECDKRYPNKGGVKRDDTIFHTCGYSIKKGNTLYKECEDRGGLVRIGSSWGGGSIEEYCMLTYYMDNYSFPKNYEDCRKYFPNSGGSSIDENDGKIYCGVTYFKYGNYDSRQGENLYQECINRGGIITSRNDEGIIKNIGDERHLEFCTLKFYDD